MLSEWTGLTALSSISQPYGVSRTMNTFRRVAFLHLGLIVAVLVHDSSHRFGRDSEL
jgi:hypothetical protein